MDRNNECLITGTVGLQNHPVAGNVRGEEGKGVRQRENKKKAGAQSPRDSVLCLCVIGTSRNHH